MKRTLKRIIEIIGCVLAFIFLLCLGCLVWIWDTITRKKVSKEELEVYREVLNEDYEGHRGRYR